MPTGRGDDGLRWKWDQVDGRRVRIWTVPPARPGSGALPCLLLHGLGCSGETWAPTLRQWFRMGVDRPVFAPDMPGYGRSPGPPGHTLNIDELADWCARFLDVLGIARAHIAGNSMGCQVSLALARRHPDRVGGLVLGGPTEGADVIPFWRMALGLGADIFDEPVGYTLTLLKMYAQQGPARYFATVRAMNADDPVRHAKQVRAPVLLVRGGRDKIVPDRAGHAFARVLPDAAYVTVDSFSHAAQFAVPDVFLRVALAFWNRTEAGERAPEAAHHVVRAATPVPVKIQAP